MISFKAGKLRRSDRRRCGLLWLSAIFIAVLLGSAAAQPLARLTPPAFKPKPDASDRFFNEGMIPQLRIEISPAELKLLRQNNRAYVRCNVRENGVTLYEGVGVHLKGQAGSFRDLNDHPALTLNMDKFTPGQKFHDLDKFHLNNSVQDPTYLHELICSELFLAAGVPTARTTHARVWLNGRDLGFYVLKEGFDKTFLKRHFADASGNLYDGGFVQDLDGEAKKQTGEGPDDRSDLMTLVAAAREPDAAKRNARLAELVDVEKFLTFMALELMTSHWDGYCQNRNNYRVYFDPGAKRWHFFPHGMDQMFGDVNFGVLGEPGALVAQPIMRNPQWRARYRQRLTELLPLFSPPDRLLKRVDEVHARIRPVLSQMSAQRAREHDGQVRGLKEQIVARAKNLTQQVAAPEPKPLVVNAAGIAELRDWQPRAETEDARHELAEVSGEPKSYSIACGPSGRCVASWRCRVLLAEGKYRFEGKVRSSSVAALKDPQGTGAGLRISGGQRTNRLVGTTGWQTLSHEFEIGGTQEVELVAELRATAGSVWFDAGSLKLVRIAKPANGN